MTSKIKIERIKVGRSWGPNNWSASMNPATRIGFMQKVLLVG
jgi:hypothetical protein